MRAMFLSCLLLAISDCYRVQTNNVCSVNVRYRNYNNGFKQSSVKVGDKFLYNCSRNFLLKTSCRMYHCPRHDNKLSDDEFVDSIVANISKLVEWKKDNAYYICEHSKGVATLGVAENCTQLYVR
ncbi:unnamed protein product [Auanema sp. JU1783]|nr:unnamed protein product [Auanema sp. JU1783]